MVTENHNFNVQVDINGSLKKIRLSAPKSLDLVAATESFRGISQHPVVQNKLYNLDRKIRVKILASSNEVVGISIPDMSDEIKS
ncbi:MAG TPA: hypothetical protein VKC53_04140 [Patescibacteria group bacterium]|nr:hypothetical protein [Patescibacteria group bacterium]